MKKIVLSAAAVAMMATSPAFAQRLSGGDGVGTYNISGSASSFCQLGPVNGSSIGEGTNTTVDFTTPNDNGFSGGTSDAQIRITQLQDENDHAAAWNARINMSNSVCNSAYTVTASNANGGLAYAGNENGPSADFTKKLAYTVQASFDNRSGPARTARNLQNGATLLTSNRASAGTFGLVFDGAADTSKYLLSGDYKDTVTVILTANTGGDA